MASQLEGDPRIPELLYDIIDLLEMRRVAPSREALDEHCRAYDFVAMLSWEDEVDEREWVLAQLAFLAWNQGRLLDDYPATQQWQARCSQHSLAQEHVRNFLRIPIRERSEDLKRRYLSDESVLLTVLSHLEVQRKSGSSEVGLETAALYEWIFATGAQAGLEDELVEYLAASLALTTLGAKISAQHREDVPMWFDRVERHIDSCAGTTLLRAHLDHRRVSNLYLDNDYVNALERIDPVIGRFQELRMNESAVKALFLKALLLKESGQLEEGLAVFDEVRHQSRIDGVSGLESSAVSQSAQILGMQGRFAEAIHLAREGLALSRDAGFVAVATAQGTVGELLRDRGDFESSIAAYAACVKTYQAGGFFGLAAYMRVLVAEVLLLAGRPREAGAEVVAALPTIERHWLTQEALAATRILREAIRRQQGDPEALRQLREQLQLMREQGKL